MNAGPLPRFHRLRAKRCWACAALIVAASMLAFPVSVGARAGRASADLIAAAGDIASAHGAQASTAQLIRRHLPRAHVLTLGDNAYPNNSPADYAKYYAPTWGRFKSITLPSPGNHEYRTPKAAGYFDYFHRPAYYAHAEGSWLLLSLDSVCGKVGGCTRSSPQGRWLAAKLAHTTRRCILAFFHHPLFNAGRHGPTPAVRPLWTQLYAAHADVILNGHDHNYQRYNTSQPRRASHQPRHPRVRRRHRRSRALRPPREAPNPLPHRKPVSTACSSWHSAHAATDGASSTPNNQVLDHGKTRCH